MDRERMKHDLEEVDQAQLESALTAPEKSSLALLSKQDSLRLLKAMDGLVRRYPSQDQESSIEEFLKDYAELAEKHGICRVEKAIDALRLSAKFFPKPDEVAQEIDDQAAKSGYRTGFLTDWQRIREQYNSPEEKAWRKSQGYEVAE